MLFLNLFAYFGITSFACMLSILGWQMTRSRTMHKTLSAFLGEERAHTVLDQRQFDYVTGRLIGILFLATGLFLGICVIRGLLP